jgi:hypothetical protein
LKEVKKEVKAVSKEVDSPKCIASQKREVWISNQRLMGRGWLSSRTSIQLANK